MSATTTNLLHSNNITIVSEFKRLNGDVTLTNLLAKNVMEKTNLKLKASLEPLQNFSVTASASQVFDILVLYKLHFYYYAAILARPSVYARLWLGHPP